MFPLGMNPRALHWARNARPYGLFDPIALLSSPPFPFLNE
jgi:hypothetical protein